MRKIGLQTESILYHGRNMLEEIMERDLRLFLVMDIYRELFWDIEQAIREDEKARHER